MNAVVSAGEMSAEEAEKSPQAHAITHWLGADAGENSAADTARFLIPQPGLLLLCTDGLWNYAAAPGAMAQAVKEANENGADALAVARRLIEFAIERGGHDNITAIVLRWEP
jgi:serine/threonine protein phosphatase PrpC